MHKIRSEADSFVADFLPAVNGVRSVDIVICPPFTSLAAVGEAIRGSGVKLGAQNVHWENQGAYTGEISPAMLLDLGCKYVIIGHSERRQLMKETDEDINRKIKASLSAGLIPIFCIGETLTERESQQAQAVVRSQLENGLKDIVFEQRGLVIAYEPVWAIGTGVNASPDDAQDMCSFIRQHLAALYDNNLADSIPVLYGGSVKPDNIASFMLRQDIDGALVGGASLNPVDFAQIVRLGE
jgi:triosephosphate isomerase